MGDIQSVMITGANAGLGLECARQLADLPGIDRIYLACRSEDKARNARAHLEASTGRSIFEIVLIDMMNPGAIRTAVERLSSPIDAIVLNAGGAGGATPDAVTPDGVTHIFASNILGHAVLVEELLRRNLLTTAVVYAGSETARGIPKMGIARPTLKSGSVEEFTSIADGSLFPVGTDPLKIYASIKLVATHWIGSMSRRVPHVRFVTMSPGGTTGTNGMDDLPFLKKLLFKHVGGWLMPMFGMMHGVETGARRYIDALRNNEYETGRFYASSGHFPTGPVVDQATIYGGFSCPSVEDSAYEAVRRFCDRSAVAWTATESPSGTSTIHNFRENV